MDTHGPWPHRRCRWTGRNPLCVGWGWVEEGEPAEREEKSGGAGAAKAWAVVEEEEEEKATVEDKTRR